MSACEKEIWASYPKPQDDTDNDRQSTMLTLKRGGRPPFLPCDTNAAALAMMKTIPPSNKGLNIKLLLIEMYPLDGRYLSGL